jgi:Transcription factor WhiB
LQHSAKATSERRAGKRPRGSNSTARLAWPIIFADPATFSCSWDLITGHLIYNEPAKAVCAECLVRAECRDAGIEGDEVGIWGGTTGRERRRLRLARRDTAA